MSRPTGADVQAAFCAVVVDEWARAGVTHAVLAPGSRSTPLVVALDAEPRIRVYVVLDERAAGFVALGIAVPLIRERDWTRLARTTASMDRAAAAEAFRQHTAGRDLV